VGAGGWGVEGRTGNVGHPTMTKHGLLPSLSSTESLNKIKASPHVLTLLLLYTAIDAGKCIHPRPPCVLA